MSISRVIAEQMKDASWIRRMFEEAAQLKQTLGEDAVLDFSLGNPVLAPPAEFSAALREVVAEAAPDAHRYMSNSGYADTRRAVAAFVRGEYACPALTENHVLLSCGAAGGLNVVLKALLDAGDEVIAIVPYFPEYRFYVTAHGGVLKLAESREDFQLDAQAIAKAITPRTKAIIVNSPNNPTGVVYSEQATRELVRVLSDAEARCGHPIYLLADDIYRRIAFSGVTVCSTLNTYRNTVVVSSFSKDLSIPGERIGYVAIGPQAADGAALFDACVFATRTLGFVNAPALMQRVISRCLRAKIDVSSYQRNRDVLCAALVKGGFGVQVPGGAFYIFPKCPTADDLACCAALRAKNVFVVPGSGFGRPGYIRLAYAVSFETCQRAAPILATGV